MSRELLQVLLDSDFPFLCPDSFSNSWGAIVPYRNYFDGENEVLSLENTLFWKDIVEKSTGRLGSTPSPPPNSDLKKLVH